MRPKLATSGIGGSGQSSATVPRREHEALDLHPGGSARRCAGCGDRGRGGATQVVTARTAPTRTGGGDALKKKLLCSPAAIAALGVLVAILAAPQKWG